jgi:ketosteroid isomerase-like protein
MRRETRALARHAPRQFMPRQKWFVLSSPAGGHMKRFTTKYFAMSAAWIVLTLVLMAAAAPAAAQKNKDKKKDQPKTDAPIDVKSLLPDSQAIDQTIGEALGYWQIGDADSLHKYYSDDVVVVSGLWEPPVMGWANYLKAYEAQRASVTGQRMERSNTLIKVNGNFAWATYQFVYAAMIDGKVAQFHGHTSLILNKQGNRWVIVLNHSSVVDSAFSNPVPPANSAQPGQP